MLFLIYIKIINNKIKIILIITTTKINKDSHLEILKYLKQPNKRKHRLIVIVSQIVRIIKIHVRIVMIV